MVVGGVAVSVVAGLNSGKLLDSVELDSGELGSGELDSEDLNSGELVVALQPAVPEQSLLPLFETVDLASMVMVKVLKDVARVLLTTVLCLLLHPLRQPQRNRKCASSVRHHPRINSTVAAVKGRLHKVRERRRLLCYLVMLRK